MANFDKMKNGFLLMGAVCATISAIGSYFTALVVAETVSLVLWYLGLSFASLVVLSINLGYFEAKRGIRTLKWIAGLAFFVLVAPFLVGFFVPDFFPNEYDRPVLYAMTLMFGGLCLHTSYFREKKFLKNPDTNDDLLVLGLVAYVIAGFVVFLGSIAHRLPV